MSSQCDHFWMMLNSALSLVWKHINLFGLWKTWVINSGVEDYIINWEFNLITRPHAGWIFFFFFGCAGSCCCVWTLWLRCTGSSSREASLAVEYEHQCAWASGVVARELIFPVACGIFLDQGSHSCLLHWQAEFFTTEPPGKHQGQSVF